MNEDWMVTIPKGSIFLRDDRKKETRLELIESFLLSKYLITQEVYEKIMNENPSTFVSADNPVEGVTWYKAIEFCNLLSNASGLQKCYEIDSVNKVVNLVPGSSGYRLPTDAEWEFSCLSNSSDVQYGPIDKIAWFDENSNNSTQAVGKKTPNQFGLFDMLGNVWEWCWDVYDPEVYGSYRVFRGGGWADSSRGCLATNRRRSHPTYAIDDLGFRVAKAIL